MLPECRLASCEVFRIRNGSQAKRLILPTSGNAHEAPGEVFRFQRASVSRELEGRRGRRAELDEGEAGAAGGADEENGRGGVHRNEHRGEQGLIRSTHVGAQSIPIHL